MKKKVLFLAANPRGTGPIAIDKEIRDIEEGIQLSSKKNLELVAKFAVRDIDIRRALLHENPTIVHFSGHGDKSGGIAIESKTNTKTFKMVNPEALAQLFSAFSDNIQCVVLNTCYSEKQAKAIVQHIPYVIGTNDEIDDEVARDFSIAFYDALSAGRDIPNAFNYGKNTLLLDDTTKTDMLKLEISELQQKLLKDKNEIAKIEEKLNEKAIEFNDLNVLETFEKELLNTTCPYPVITQWLMERRLTLVEKAQEKVFPAGDELDVKIFQNELSRHLELIIDNLLVNDQSLLDEPRLNKSFPVKIYQDGLIYIKGRIPKDRFSLKANQRIAEDMDYINSRL